MFSLLLVTGSEHFRCKEYKEKIVPALEREFGYTTVMQVPRLEKIVINQGIGAATQDKKLIETAINELTAITGQKAVATLSRYCFLAFLNGRPNWRSNA